MKKKKALKEAIDMENSDDESSPSCQTRRKIEDLHELRRYQDELGAYEEVLELS